MSSAPLFDAALLQILVCPQTRGPLVLSDDARELLSPQAQLAFPIANGVPVLLVDQARCLKNPPSCTIHDAAL